MTQEACCLVRANNRAPFRSSCRFCCSSRALSLSLSLSLYRPLIDCASERVSRPLESDQPHLMSALFRPKIARLSAQRGIQMILSSAQIPTPLSAINTKQPQQQQAAATTTSTKTETTTKSAPVARVDRATGALPVDWLPSGLSNCGLAIVFLSSGNYSNNLQPRLHSSLARNWRASCVARMHSCTRLARRQKNLSVLGCVCVCATVSATMHSGRSFRLSVQ